MVVTGLARVTLPKHSGRKSEVCKNLKDFSLPLLKVSCSFNLSTLQMFTGVYRVINRVFCNICNPVIFTDCREIL